MIPEQPLPSTRKEALLMGVKFYFSVSCKLGHNAKRHSYNGSCVECHKLIKQKHRTTEKFRQTDRAYYLNNKEHILNRQVLHRYGLTQAQFDTLYKSQNGVCAICGEGHKIKRQTRLCIDHNHDTGKIRGLLCHDCNTGIGKLKSISNLEKAIKYLVIND